MKHINRFSIVIGLALVAFSALVMARTNVERQSVKKQPTVLYSQIASSAVIDHAKKPGWYTLTLKGVSRNILWFTDRPVRKSGTITDVDFIKEWNRNKKDGFSVDNPNASLVVSFEKGDGQQEQVFVMRLANPRYDSVSKTMRYDIQFISHEGDALASKPLYDAALFIDNNCFWCTASLH